MDFKELLSLAKDNQSFAMKKFQRDSNEKAKGRMSGVSDSAVKSFLAKRRQAEEQRKATEEADKRKRILARLDAEHGKRKKVKEKSNDIGSEMQKKSKTLPTNKEVRHEKDLPKAVTDGERKEHGKNSERQERFQIPKKKAIKRSAETASEDQSLVSTNGSNMKSAPSDESGICAFKQHRRRKGKESDFEWSGSAAASSSQSSPVASKSRAINKKLGKKSGNAPSFQELMSIAQQQKDKPVAILAKAKGGAMKSSCKNPESTENISNSNNSITSDTRKNSDFREKYSSGIDNKKEVSARNDIKNEISRKNRCTVTTHTINVKSNYDAIGNPVSAQRNYDNRSRLANGKSGLRTMNEHMGSNAKSKKSKVSSIDKELERERMELERKRNLLRRKMQGGRGNNDYCDEYNRAGDSYDDLDDFIDDNGADFDYSKHIRGIFGYDRRRYIDEEDDLKDMESNYRQIAAEEARSTRIAKLEDEIERRKEDLEKKKTKRFKS